MLFTQENKLFRQDIKSSEQHNYLVPTTISCFDNIISCSDDLISCLDDLLPCSDSLFILT